MTGKTKRPRISLVMGDAAGIGPELVVNAVQDDAAQRQLEAERAGSAKAGSRYR